MHIDLVPSAKIAAVIGETYRLIVDGRNIFLDANHVKSLEGNIVSIYPKSCGSTAGGVHQRKIKNRPRPRHRFVRDAALRNQVDGNINALFNRKLVGRKIRPSINENRVPPGGGRLGFYKGRKRRGLPCQDCCPRR